MLEQTTLHKYIGIPVKALFASLLSMLVPGLGQISAHKGERGVAILVVTIIVGHLNVIWLSLFATASPGEGNFWTYNLPLLLNDILVAYAVIFLIWQIVDAYQLAKNEFFRIEDHGN